MLFSQCGSEYGRAGGPSGEVTAGRLYYASTSDGIPESEALYCIPVEAKQRLARKHMAQLGQYQASLSTGPFMRERVSVRFLLDEMTSGVSRGGTGVFEHPPQRPLH